MNILKISLAFLIIFGSYAYANPQGFGGSYQQGVHGSVPGGFNNAAPNTVAGVKQGAWDDQIVQLRGRLTNYIGRDKYEFTDLQGGTIEVELDDDRPWGHISRGQLIDIVGEVDRDLFWVTIDVQHATPVAASAPAATPAPAIHNGGYTGYGAPQGQYPQGQYPAGQYGAPAPYENAAVN